MSHKAGFERDPKASDYWRGFATQMTPLTSLEAISAVSDALVNLAPPVVIAVDGHSAAGKSTFAEELARHIGAAIVASDDFYRVMEPTARQRLTPAEGAALYYDWERLRGDVLEPFRQTRVATFQRYDWAANRLGETTAIGPTDRLIIEGLFVSRRELADLVDLSVFVDTDTSTRLRRQVDRNDASRSWLHRWDAAERWFFEHLRPQQTFDITVHGS